MANDDDLRDALIAAFKYAPGVQIGHPWDIDNSGEVAALADIALSVIKDWTVPTSASGE